MLPGMTLGEPDASDVETSRKLQEMYRGEHHVGVVSAEEIRDWAHDLPAAYESLFYETWGQPPATLPVKGLRYGNVLVLLQDMRGMEDLSVIHDKKAPPSPWLLASYRYATRRFNADAIVHVGTHGLVEWSRGKEWCPAAGDYPEFLVDNAPHAYIFNVPRSRRGIDRAAAVVRDDRFASVPSAEVGRGKLGLAQSAPVGARLLQYAGRSHPNA